MGARCEAWRPTQISPPTIRSGKRCAGDVDVLSFHALRPRRGALINPWISGLALERSYSSVIVDRAEPQSMPNQGSALPCRPDSRVPPVMICPCDCPLWVNRVGVDPAGRSCDCFDLLTVISRLRLASRGE